MYALDANTVIHLFKGMGGIAKRFLGVPPVEIALPAVVLCELEVGRLKSRNPKLASAGRVGSPSRYAREVLESAS